MTQYPSSLLSCPFNSYISLGLDRYEQEGNAEPQSGLQENRWEAKGSLQGKFTSFIYLKSRLTLIRAAISSSNTEPIDEEFC